jgi:hypothetical protein
VTTSGGTPTSVKAKKAAPKATAHGPTALPDQTHAVNAAAARRLVDVTRADTHDGAIPRHVRTGLVGLAALALLAVLLVPRAPALLFARRLDDDGYQRGRGVRRRRGVATMPASTKRP